MSQRFRLPTQAYEPAYLQFYRTDELQKRVKDVVTELAYYLNLMAQYHPAGKVHGEMFAEINRCITRQENGEALKSTRTEGFYRFD